MGSRLLAALLYCVNCSWFSQLPQKVAGHFVHNLLSNPMRAFTIYFVPFQHSMERILSFHTRLRPTTGTVDIIV